MSAKAYGSLYNHDGQSPVKIDAVNVPAMIETGMEKGRTRKMEYVPERALQIKKKGIYEIKWSISFKMMRSNNREVEGAAAVNGVFDDQSSAHRYIADGTDTGNMGGVSILKLKKGDLVGLVMRNETNADDILIDHANLTVVMIGR